MAVTLSEFLNQTAIATEQGSPYAAIILKCADAADTTDSNAVDLPWIKTSTIQDTTDSIDIEDEANDTFTLAGGKRTGNLELTFMQQDASSRNIYNTLRDYKFILVKEMSKGTINGKKQIAIFPNCKVVPSLDLSLPGHEVKLTVKPMIAAEDTTVDLAVLTSNFYNTWTGLATIDKGELVLITEVAA